ncbi:uncharacterized protein LOC122536325 [Frieseomelitta varia]|uniref:uncharacterized protein LOC122536325 n=1 Tax=Frieseomelitta varia TaxID=561572 RepID=UPI001CB67D8F|nr:uncharacterized protein LOC122536325 [Frieseomelitta varia]
MYRPIFAWFLLLALVATTYSKSINVNSEDIGNHSTDRISATFSPSSQTESNSKANNKRSLLILLPKTKEEENTECQNQKTKRCKTSFRRDTAIPKEKHRTTFKPRNTGNPPNNERDREYFVGQKRNLQLLSSKEPLAKPGPHPVTMEQAMNATFRDASVLDSLRKQLTPNSPTVAASQPNFAPKTSVYDDGKFICYCRKKVNPTFRKDPARVAPKPQGLSRKLKPAKKLPNRNPLVGSKQPAYANVPHESPSTKNLPPTYPTVSKYPLGYIPNNINPIFPHEGHGTIPYIPYIYHPDPRVSIPKIPDEGETPNVNTPLESTATKSDSIVGQEASISEHDPNENQRTFDQAPPNIVGKSLSQSSEDSIPATSVKENASSNSNENSNIPDYNLQSIQADPSDKNRLTPLETVDSFREDSTLQAANPGMSVASSTDLRNGFANGYETTSSGNVDYSDIKEVTTAYFTSKAYDNQAGRGYGNSLISSTGTMDSNSAELQNRHNGPAGDSGESENVGMNLDTKDLHNAKELDQGNNEENVMPGTNNPFWSQKSTSNVNSNSQEDPNCNVNLPSKHNDDSAGNSREDDGMNLNTKDLNNAGDRENNEEDVALGKNNPQWNQEESANDNSNPNFGSNVEEDEENFEHPFAEDSDEIGTTIGDGPSNEKSSAEDYASELPETENNAGPLKTDYEKENSVRNKFEEKLESEEKNFINTDNERVGAVQVTIQRKNEDDPSIDPTLGLSRIDDDDNRATNDASNQLPFCDNTLLQKSIKTAINNFATADSSEMNENENEETVGAAKGEDLLPEVVQVPNLKGILSMPAIERTLLDKIKNLLSKATGMGRENFDSDWATNVIKDNLRHTLAAAPGSKTELPPMTVEEHQFKNGKWVTNMVTLEPTDEKDRTQTDVERIQSHVKNLLRDPTVGLQAAKNPAVQNMIVQSVRHIFKPKNAANDENIDSIIQSTLNDELNIMEMESDEIPTTENISESESESTTFDVSNIDMNKLLDIAKSEAGLDDNKDSELPPLESSTYEKDEENVKNQQTLSPAMDSLDGGIVGEAMNFGTKANQDTEESSEQNQTPDNMKELETEPIETSGIWNVAATLEVKDESSTTKIEDYASVEYDSPTINSAENAGATYMEEAENVGRSMEQEDKSSTPYTDDATSAEDFTYLGKIAMKNRNNADDVQSLRNSELFYVGDGVKLPLEIRKLNDGSYALSISRKVCEQLLNQECPCCVPREGNVTRTVRRNLEMENADGRISKRESVKSILLNEGERCNPADDSLQIFSMPVETFARRYNLSLNLEKVQTPWDFDAKGKIDGRSRDRSKNYKNKNDSGNFKNKRTYNNLHNDAASFDLERYRYQRNINESADKRVEIITQVLNWLRDMVLSTNNKR